jgi:hypothetical protein
VKDRRKRDRVIALRSTLARRVEAFTRRYGQGRETRDVVEKFVETGMMYAYRGGARP